jgi:hypothetical protein
MAATAALEGEALFMWLYERREDKEDELSFNQFGDFTPAQADRLALQWFPESAVKQGQLQSVWKNHPTNKGRTSYSQFVLLVLIPICHFISSIIAIYP